ncbi:hypothetical protein AMQ84_03150, partial [Paenibacillus riograndensis]
MQTQATATKEKENTSGSHKPYSNPLTFVRPAATKLPDPVEIIRRVRQNPASLSREDKLALQRTLGNRAVVQLLSSLKDGPKDEKKTDNSPEKAGGQGQGSPETESKQMQPQEQRPEPVQAKVEPLSAQTEPKAQQNEKPSLFAKVSSALKEQSKPLAKNSPSGAKAGKGKADEERPDGKEKAAAPQATETEKAQVAEAQDAKNVNEGKESKGAKEAKSEKKSKAEDAKGESAPKEPSLGEALDALAGEGKEEPAKAKKVNIHGEDPGQILDQLTHVQPTEIGDAYAQAVDVSAGALAKQKQKTRQGLPVIPTPTGLKGKVLQARKKIAPLKHDVPDSYKSERSGGSAQPGNLGRMDIGSSGSEGNPEAMLGEIRSAAAVPPEISMTGEADPSQLEGFSQEASQQVGAAKRAEMGQISHP